MRQAGDGAQGAALRVAQRVGDLIRRAMGADNVGEFHPVGLGSAACQREPKIPQLWELKIPHPRVHSEASAGRTRPALSLSLSR